MSAEKDLGEEVSEKASFQSLIQWAPGVFSWLFLWALIALPVVLALEHLQRPPAIHEVLIGAAGIILLLFSAIGRIQSSWFRCFLALIALAVLLVRCLHFGLVDFSGSGFSAEFFIHMEWQSVVLAWQEQARTLRRVLVLLLLFIGLFWLACRNDFAVGRRWAGLLAITGLGLIYLGRAGLPEYDLWQAWQQWSRPLSSELDPVVLDRFEALGLVEPEIFSKDQVRAEAGESPTNLILVYVESLGRNLADQPQWPNLMPNYQRMLDEHAWVDSIWASSYITIEGLTNSMCGTLFPFGRGNDSMAAGDGLAEDLPCLGDVLEIAGYDQVYLGGAQMEFAGKGAFLAAHGFQQQKGLGYWREQGLRPRRGTWGLSDVDLFDQATAEIARLREQPAPFNLTLLTIGTHLPGYLYDECDPYPHSDELFLQALHCTDQLLAAWIDELDDKGFLDDTLMVITADHHVFRNPKMQSLFGDDVYDRRLPFLVIGDSQRAAATDQGAGYDLAPTILDLLDIEHNAGFLLGRSLVQSQDRPDYFPTRYTDIHRGQRVINSDVECTPADTDGVSLPLSSCEKRQLLSLLETMVATVSRPRIAINCESKRPMIIEIPEAPDQALRFLVNGLDESGRFTYRSRPVVAEDAGIYALAFDGFGSLIASQYFPLNSLTSFQAFHHQTVQLGAEQIAVTWKPSDDSISENRGDDLLDPLDKGLQPSWIILDEGGELLARSAPPPDQSNSITMDLTEEFCSME